MIDKPCQRKSLRLKDYNYSTEGAYFVTICTHGGKSLFGFIKDAESQLSLYRKIIADTWHEIPQRFSNVELDCFVVMPNHMHGIIKIVGAGFPRPHAIIDPEILSGETSPRQVHPNLSQIIGWFKYNSAKRINEIRKTVGVPVWQRGFYEHVVRKEESLNRIREYIVTNPLRWELDRENPRATAKDDFDTWLESFKTKPVGKKADTNAIGDKPQL